MATARKLRGRAWVFGDSLDVDWDICDLHALQEQVEKGIFPSEEELGRQCLVRVDPDFPRKVRQGDLVVAGEGAGYSAACLDGMPADPHMFAFATKALRGAGVAAVLCESAAANFLRNSLDDGFPVVECRGIRGMVRQGDELEVDLESGAVRNLTTGAQMQFPPFPDFILQMLEAGGLYPYAEKQAREGKS
ncbi:MAG: hypothetical protein HY686_05265 [Chloroflexi bacterium]|nr:hypothetical protein [Chloroflexota bacterium]